MSIWVTRGRGRGCAVPDESLAAAASCLGAQRDFPRPGHGRACVRDQAVARRNATAATAKTAIARMNTRRLVVSISTTPSGLELTLAP